MLFLLSKWEFFHIESLKPAYYLYSSMLLFHSGIIFFSIFLFLLFLFFVCCFFGFPNIIMYILSITSIIKKNTIKELVDFIYENYYKRSAFSKEKSYYLMKY